MREEWIKHSDSVKSFIIDCVIQDPDAYIEKEQLYEEYEKYCRKKNYPILSNITFNRDIISNLGVIEFRPQSINRKRCWRGLTIKTKEKTSEKTLKENWGDGSRSLK